jgi:hypothetical protein
MAISVTGGGLCLFGFGIRGRPAQQNAAKRKILELKS